MKKVFLVFLVFISLISSAESLKGGVSEDCIPRGFFGSWGVISKLKSTNNSQMFNKESRDVWTLSGFSNILILENPQSGAKSQILIKEKNNDGKTLKFERQKIVSKNGEKTIFKETVSFVLEGNRFLGSDDFVVEKYDDRNKLIKKNHAKYSVSGVKIEGKAPQISSFK